ncbi:MAG: three component ABC system middle component [Phenylobacterium sp.]|uniref:three component ABC system middle component n=1 Tax=Phenylobacterium sp. TaxID=1871053 RepID=UPI00391A5295
MAETRWSLRWNERPSEEAALFNPAFCGELIYRCVFEYEGIRATPMPLALAFVVLPLTLHPATRVILPGRANATLVTWAAERGPHLAELPDRVLALRPIAREALLFMTQAGALAVTAAGLQRGDAPLRLSAKRPAATPESEEIRRAAGLLGRWFANQGGAAAVLQALGVRP